jgi:DNA excision repair protein ERCC-4
MTILMDYREAMNRQLVTALRSHPGVELETATLKTGDFLVDNLLLIERKTFRDFVLSIKDGRLFRQAARLATAKKITTMILEGTSGEIKSIGMKREALQGAMICLSIKFNLPVLRSRSPKETAWLIAVAAGQCTPTKRAEKQLFPRPAPTKRRNTHQKQLFILQGLPGIGPKRAKLLLKRFGSLKAVFSADPTVFKKVGGIGNVTAEKIWEVINSNHPSDGCRNGP